jgi:hypothetical protein
MEPQDNRSFFEPEIGPPLTSPNGTTTGAKVSFSLAFTKAQFLAFEQFYKTDLKFGAKAFEMLDPLTDAAAVWKFGRSPYSVQNFADGVVQVGVNLVRLS